jgi:hypothetical protein
VWYTHGDVRMLGYQLRVAVHTTTKVSPKEMMTPRGVIVMLQ